MSGEVKRYTIDVYDEDEAGDWVRFDDFARVRTQRDALHSALLEAHGAVSSRAAKRIMRAAINTQREEARRG